MKIKKTTTYMSPKDLKVGNLVLIKARGGLYEIQEVQTLGVVIIDKTEVIFVKYIDLIPAPLRAKYMTLLGFISMYVSHTPFEKNGVLAFPDDDNIFGNIHFGLEKSTLKFVHELQNLYHELKKEALTVI